MHFPRCRGQHVKCPFRVACIPRAYPVSACFLPRHNRHGLGPCTHRTMLNATLVIRTQRECHTKLTSMQMHALEYVCLRARAFNNIHACADRNKFPFIVLRCCQLAVSRSLLPASRSCHTRVASNWTSVSELRSYPAIICRANFMGRLLR